MQKERPFVISIAGFDPSGGAGILADTKTFEQIGVTGFGVCTALTQQTESQCLRLEWRPLQEIIQGICILMDHYPVSAVKIGIVKDAEYLDEIIKTVQAYNFDIKIVWDPVLKSTSEFSFFNLETLSMLKNTVDKISLITPNYNEYGVLKDYNLFSDENLRPVLIKGGHREDQLGTDVLVEKGNEIILQPTDANTVYYPKHGSGCVMSSAIAGYLAKGESLEIACRKGKLYIEKFLKSSPGLLGTHS
ncbi:hydroxymethylpyrimidine/phosphomethylpyrimidine kinase [Chryseobacterium lactis]|uniref:hydroxymethylpyrimidine kinase n=1 Tax=Chryseobacterium lactis TaxID=1241981 RepID=A0A3G6RW17_CHRLC|nr:hydroxymethylpyrimidine/phosphomethylpyrimidine kinase [Chryseobacterium lactis]AZA81093.1 hydroxymethylpyrimidine/phosphomethylpyrimidine kinase [Chryseobacterium lactis]AZB06094.1 hydroxymethylpyrimidine/phosphomethylpyrimidine kinase [Chryseobacterium lactis]PNW14944.1 hydroxymethylpyrimidine/phosphomethylpyrimidine kinase [Chryseobacterium lactis]